MINRLLFTALCVGFITGPSKAAQLQQIQHPKAKLQMCSAGKEEMGLVPLKEFQTTLLKSQVARKLQQLQEGTLSPILRQLCLQYIQTNLALYQQLATNSRKTEYFVDLSARYEQLLKKESANCAETGSRNNHP